MYEANIRALSDTLYLREITGGGRKGAKATGAQIPRGARSHLAVRSWKRVFTNKSVQRPFIKTLRTIYGNFSLVWRGLWKPLIYLSKYLRVDTPSRTYREVLGRSVLEGLVHSPSWLTIPGWSTVTVWHICPGCKRSSRGRLNRYLSGVIQRGFHPEDKLHKCLEGPFHSRILGL